MTNRASDGGDAIRRENARIERNRAQRQAVRNATPLELALNKAREYREQSLREGSNHARCQQLVEDIRGLVGYTVGEVGERRMLIPDAVRAEMGLGPNPK